MEIIQTDYEFRLMELIGGNKNWNINLRQL